MKNKKMDWRRIVRDTLLSIGILAITILICSIVSNVHGGNNPFAAPLFILAVAIIARFTSGYMCGIAASLASVLCVNYLFTYPFYQFNLTISGYPLTFAAMLIVSMIISTLTTQIKRQEQLRLEAEAEKMRANLLRSVSHDLRTPLSAIYGSTNVLMENEAMDASERMELLRSINSDAQWLIRVMENILTITRCSGDAVELRLEPEVIEEIIGSAIVKFSRKYPNYKITVDRPEEILLANMDAMLIEQVLINIFENVPDHAPNATEIHIALFRTDEEVHVCISDNGGGFPSAMLPKVFDGLAMSKAHVSDSRRSMGIGLSVCRSILRAHHGDIVAFNTNDGGAVEFHLPVEEGIINE